MPIGWASAAYKLDFQNISLSDSRLIDRFQIPREAYLHSDFYDAIPEHILHDAMPVASLLLR